MHRLVIALVTLLGLTGATVVGAYLFLFSASTDRAATLAPADSAFYVNLYLQPSSGQQMQLSELIGRLPGFADDASLDEKVDQVVQNLLAGTGFDYRQEIKPWLGNQVAVAGWPGADPLEPTPVVLAAVKDAEVARETVRDLVAGEEVEVESETYEGVELLTASATTYAFVDEMLVVSPDSGAVRAVVDVSRGAPSLAGHQAFATTMDQLEPDHLATAFLDLGAMAEATDASDEFGGVSTAGVVLVAEDGGLRLSGHAPFDDTAAGPSDRAGFALGGEPSSLVDWMPEDTLAEVVVFGLRQTLEDAEAAVGATPEGEELMSTIDTFRALAAFGLGIDLDTDLLPLLDREVAVAFTGLDGELPSGQILLRPADAEAAADALDRVTDALANVGAGSDVVTSGETEITILTLPDFGEIAYALVDDIVILGLGQDDVEAAIEAHANGTSLGSSEAYTRTFAVAGTRGGNELFVDVGALLELVGTPVELPADARDILLEIGTLGVTAPSRDHQIEFHAVLTVEP